MRMGSRGSFRCCQPSPHHLLEDNDQLLQMSLLKQIFPEPCNTCSSMRACMPTPTDVHHNPKESGPRVTDRMTFSCFFYVEVRMSAGFTPGGCSMCMAQVLTMTLIRWCLPGWCAAYSSRRRSMRSLLLRSSGSDSCETMPNRFSVSTEGVIL